MVQMANGAKNKSAAINQTTFLVSMKKWWMPTACASLPDKFEQKYLAAMLLYVFYVTSASSNCWGEDRKLGVGIIS